jgi:hypothetical protein
MAHDPLSSPHDRRQMTLTFKGHVEQQRRIGRLASKFRYFHRATLPLFLSPLIIYETGHGPTFQMPAAYSAMVRSLENFPEAATFKIALRAQALGSAYKSRSR